MSYIISLQSRAHLDEFVHQSLVALLSPVFSIYLAVPNQCNLYKRSRSEARKVRTQDIKVIVAEVTEGHSVALAIGKSHDGWPGGPYRGTTACDGDEDL